MPTTTKILVIDDESMLHQSLKAYLEDSGFVVYAAENGQQGLEVFQQIKPDIVLTDLQMPDCSGLEILTQITHKAPDIPVIVISGAGGMSDVIEALRGGAWDYITKPITDMAVLEHAIYKSLERHHLMAENKKYRESLEHNLAILEEDQEAGRSVQARLLPRQNLQVKNFTFSHRLIPSLYLSGDFLNYFAINKTQVAFYLADVSGHGVSSAFITVLLKGLISRYFNAYQLHHEDNTILKPDELVSALSQEIYEAKLGKYLTIVYCILDLETYQIKYTIGGHYPSPILTLPKQAPSYTAGSGHPVGIVSNPVYHVETIELLPGSSLTIFSDGVMEIIKRPGADAKEKYLLEMVEQAQQDQDALLDLLRVNHSSQLPDDLTFLQLTHKS